MGGQIVFLDSETTGLDPILDEPWEVAWCKRSLFLDASKTQDVYSTMFVQHKYERAEKLPAEFKQDYDARFRFEQAITRPELASRVMETFSGRLHVVGNVPSFDTTRIGYMLYKLGLNEPWHYHVTCIENVALGYLQGRLRSDYRHMTSAERSRLTSVVNRLAIHGKSIDSNELSLSLGVDPDLYDRHTALGDVKWCVAQWDAIFNGERYGETQP